MQNIKFLTWIAIQIMFLLKPQSFSEDPLKSAFFSKIPDAWRCQLHMLKMQIGFLFPRWHFTKPKWIPKKQFILFYFSFTFICSHIVFLISGLIFKDSSSLKYFCNHFINQNLRGSLVKKPF